MNQQDIVRRLAEMDPVAADYYECVFCGASLRRLHRLDCIWAQARAMLRMDPSRDEMVNAHAEHHISSALMRIRIDNAVEARYQQLRQIVPDDVARRDSRYLDEYSRCLGVAT